MSRRPVQTCPFIGRVLLIALATMALISTPWSASAAAASEEGPFERFFDEMIGFSEKGRYGLFVRHSEAVDTLRTILNVFVQDLLTDSRADWFPDGLSQEFMRKLCGGEKSGDCHAMPPENVFEPFQDFLKKKGLTKYAFVQRDRSRSFFEVESNTLSGQWKGAGTEPAFDSAEFSLTRSTAQLTFRRGAKAIKRVYQVREILKDQQVKSRAWSAIAFGSHYLLLVATTKKLAETSEHAFAFFYPN